MAEETSDSRTPLCELETSGRRRGAPCPPEVPMNVSAGVWLPPLVALVAVLAVDLLIVGRRPHEPTMRESGAWVAFYVALAVVFGLGVWLVEGGRVGGGRSAGYFSPG